MITFRQKLKMASLSAEALGKMRFVWKHTKRQTRNVIDVYNRVKKIAEQKGVKIPQPLTKMEEEYD